MEVPGLLPHADLAVRARPLADDRLEVLRLSAGPERVHDIVDELEKLHGQLLHRHLGLLAEVDELRVHSAPHRAPLVLLDEAGQVSAESLVLPAKDHELRADGLNERGEAEGLLDTRGRIADAELDRGEERVRTQIPPDLPAIVDRGRLHQKLDEVLVLVVAREVRRDPGAREAAPDDLAVRLQPGVAREPERRRRRDREEVWKEIARLVHHLDPRLAIRDADVHVKAKDEELADHVLQLVLKDFVSLVLGYLLVLPVREGMRPSRGDPEPDRLKERRERAAQGGDLIASLGDVRADLRAGLDDRLHHLGLDLFPEPWPRRGKERLARAFELSLGVDDLELLFDADRQPGDVALSHRVAVPRRPAAPLRASIIPRCRASWRMPVAIQLPTVPYWVGDESHGTRSASSSAGWVRSSSRTIRPGLSAQPHASFP